MKILYYDCFSGISGNMNLGALIDIGIPHEFLISELKKIKTSGYKIKIEKLLKNGIHGTKIKILAEEPKIKTSFSRIKELILESNLQDKLKQASLDIFELIARAEAKVHNIPINKVHFHEIGVIDSIIDIIGATICIDYLKVDKIISSSIELGTGIVHCTHGIFPVPAPATVEILKNIPVKIGGQAFEATTPTGAAIISYFASEFKDQINLNISKIGYGIGEYTSEKPNVLRIFLAESVTNNSEQDYNIDYQMVVECNIDDMNPELYSIVFERLFAAGALDVYLTPVITKNSRPANLLTIICKQKNIEKIKETVFLNTSTLGIREYTIKKTMLKRDFTTIKTRYGEIRIKNAYFKGKLLRYKPEFKDCEIIAKKNNININDVLKELNKEIFKL